MVAIQCPNPACATSQPVVPGGSVAYHESHAHVPNFTLGQVNTVRINPHASIAVRGYSLDLTTPWNTTRPPWIRLPTSPEISTTNCVILPNMTSTPLGLKGPALLIFGNEYTSQPFASLLDLSNQTWISNATRQQVPFRPKGLVTISNPLDGKIYIRGGYHSENVSMMDIYNPQTDNFSTLPIPATPITGGDLSTGASGVPAAQWPGTSDAYVPNAVYEYTPASNNWGVLDTTGPTPTAREGACMAIDQYSTKLVIFGGQNADNVLGDIHVLDLDTLMWKEGPSAADPRIGMACAMFDDGFLTWGGSAYQYSLPVDLLDRRKGVAMTRPLAKCN
ncbi:hypothetical protein EDD21DRAFT_353023 [Dissophora ornata]|nr:hypothetical protein EDD21DRAFT_353023 [Dissophora ornata]